jgi:hypothetical protein
LALLFQSCIAYKNNSVSAQEAAQYDKRRIKIETIDGGTYKLRWIEEKDGKAYSILNTKKGFLDISTVVKIRTLDPKVSEIPLDSAINLKGNIEVTTRKTHEDFESYESFKSRNYIKIVNDGQYIIGYKMMGKDTATLIIPVKRIKSIRVENKTGTIIGTTAIVIPGLWLSSIIIVSIAYLFAPKGY